MNRFQLTELAAAITNQNNLVKAQEKTIKLLVDQLCRELWKRKTLDDGTVTVTVTYRFSHDELQSVLEHR